MPFDDQITAEPNRANQNSLTLKKKGGPFTCAILKNKYPNFDAEESGGRSSLAVVEEAPPHSDPMHQAASPGSSRTSALRAFRRSSIGGVVNLIASLKKKASGK